MQWYRVERLERHGLNAVRTSHNMPTPEWVEACDRLGHDDDVRDAPDERESRGAWPARAHGPRYRNSPSIIFWSVGNEEWTMMFQPQGPNACAT
jgi:beta-galactosidase